MWKVLIAVLAASMELQDREEFCMMVAKKSLTERGEEIKEYVEQVKIISQPAVKARLLQDAFENCVDHEGLSSINGEEFKYKAYKHYEHLVNVPLRRYKNFQDLKVGQTFNDKKAEILRRLIMKPRVMVEDL